MAHSSGRRRRRQNADPAQLILPFEKREDLRVALNSIDRRVIGVGSKRMRQLCELVMAIWLCGQRNGCRAHRRTLLDVANRNCDSGKPVIGSMSTLKRALSEATRLGLIRSEQADGPAERDVNEDRIAELVHLSRERRRAEKWARGGPGVGQGCAAPEPRPLLYPNHQTSKPNQSSSTSSKLAALPAEVEEAMKVMIRKLRERLDPPLYIEQAFRQALANGCTIPEIGLHFDWFDRNRDIWAPDKRPGAMYRGLVNAVPGLTPGKIWPYRRGART